MLQNVVFEDVYKLRHYGSERYFSVNAMIRDGWEKIYNSAIKFMFRFVLDDKLKIVMSHKRSSILLRQE